MEQLSTGLVRGCKTTSFRTSSQALITLRWFTIKELRMANTTRSLLANLVFEYEDRHLSCGLLANMVIWAILPDEFWCGAFLFELEL